MARPLPLRAWLPVVALLAPSGVSAVQLSDGTPVIVRLLRPINSETSKSGQSLEFVVTSDVIVDGEVLITRGTRAVGMIVESRRARWRFSDHDHPRLAFRLHYTIASSGQVINLRASPTRRRDNHLVVDRLGRRHELQWAGEADTFETYVDGNYDW